MLKKPLVSGSALQFEGQLTVYGYANGPCYRCIFPKPPPANTVTNCGDGGVIGAVPGVIGILQALEAIKIVLQLPETLSGRLLLFDGARATFRTVRLRGKRVDCQVCSDTPTITELIDYEQFCGQRASDKDLSLEILSPDQRISVGQYYEMTLTKMPHLLIDVRSENEFEICKLEESINIPIKAFQNDALGEDAEKLLNRIREEKTPAVIFLCRRGNDSQIAAQRVLKLVEGSGIVVKDIIGGLHSWAAKIDPEFPVY